MSVSIKTTGECPQSEDHFMKALGERMRLVRDNSGMDQAEWALKMGRVAQAVSNWETGRSSPHLSDFVKYATILGVDLHWLLTGEQHDPLQPIQAYLKILQKPVDAG